jgi:hypothetical protein
VVWFCPWTTKVLQPPLYPGAATDFTKVVGDVLQKIIGYRINVPEALNLTLKSK